MTDKPKTRELIAFSVDRERSDSGLILFYCHFEILLKILLQFFLKKGFCFLCLFVRKRIMCIKFETGSEQVGTFGVLSTLF